VDPDPAGQVSAPKSAQKFTMVWLHRPLIGHFCRRLRHDSFRLSTIFSPLFFIKPQPNRLSDNDRSRLISLEFDICNECRRICRPNDVARNTGIVFTAREYQAQGVYIESAYRNSAQYSFARL
jgi:hypothetical protein